MAREIQFLLNDRAVSCRAHVATPLLDVIRGEFAQKATKEGCREGDCGACTVLIGRLHAGVLRYQAVTSCLVPVGDVAGQHVVTVEGLQGTAENPTPVQAALVEALGTQCGFCTPGIVMALTGFLLTAPHLDANEAKLALAGNICRCTGYAPILRAAATLIQQHQTLALVKDRTPGLVERGALPAYFAGIAPRLAALTPLPALRTLPPGARVVAGATDLLVQGPHGLLDQEVVLASQLCDQRIERVGDDLRLGAGVTMEALSHHPEFRAFIPDMPEFATLIASQQIRERATLAGNIVNASPIGDFVLLLLALDARIVLQGPEGQREMLLDLFHLGYKQMALRPGEWLEAIRLPGTHRGQLLAFEKVSKRKHLDIASVNSALWLRVADGHIVDARLAAGGVAPIPKFLRETSQALRGMPLDNATVRHAAELARQEVTPISDVRGSARYKSLLLGRQIYSHFQRLLGIVEGLP
jgi:xanthine dehydrogenase small subunit